MRRCALLALFLALPFQLPVGAQLRPQLLGAGSADAFFTDSIVHDIRLLLNADDWRTLKARYLEDTYYPSDFVWNGIVVRSVGIKSRGSGSRSGTKPGLKVDFSRYTSDQRFIGLKSVVLRNNTQDASNMHERVSMLFFRRLGIPAPREAYARLWVNEQYAGLYTIVESLDKVFLKGAFGEDTGYFYSYDYPAGAAPYYFEYRGADPGLYVPVPFAPETHDSDPRPEFIEQLAGAVNLTSDAVFRTVMARYMDLPAILRFIALEAFLGDDDGFLGNWGMNNFYTYRFDNTTRFTIIPWDKSDAFLAGYTPSIWHNITDVPPAQRNRLMARALGHDDLYASYLDALTKCVQLADERLTEDPGGPGWLEREVRREYVQIRDAARNDEVKPFTNDQFEQSVADLLEFARQRGAFVSAEIARARVR